MKNWPLLLLMFIVLPLTGQVTSVEPIAGNSRELQEKGLKLFEFEKGRIHYEIEGQPNDTLIIVFDRFGWRQATLEHGEKTYYGMKTHINTIELLDGIAKHTINQKDKKGVTSSGNPLVTLAGYKTPEELFIAQMSLLKATKTGVETLLNSECEVWEYHHRGKHLKIWAWKGLYLKHHSHSGTYTAIKVDLSPTLDEKLFTLPQGIEWRTSEH